MSEFSPIARSPIVPAPPLDRFDGWEISRRQSSAALRVLDLTPCAKLLLRGCPTPTLRDLLPSFGHAMRVKGGLLAVATVPDQWLLIGLPDAAPPIQRWINSIELPQITLIAVTHARVLLRIAGESSARLLAKVCAINFALAAFPDGRAARTSLAGLPCEIVRDDFDDSLRRTAPEVASNATLSYLILCERQVGQYLFETLLDAGSEYHIEVDGFSFN
jgi:sarcosine oxidase gamma subunit